MYSHINIYNVKHIYYILKKNIIIIKYDIFNSNLETPTFDHERSIKLYEIIYDMFKNVK